MNHKLYDIVEYRQYNTDSILCSKRVILYNDKGKLAAFNKYGYEVGDITDPNYHSIGQNLQTLFNWILDI